MLLDVLNPWDRAGSLFSEPVEMTAVILEHYDVDAGQLILNAVIREALP